MFNDRALSCLLGSQARQRLVVQVDVDGTMEVQDEPDHIQQEHVQLALLAKSGMKPHGHALAGRGPEPENPAVQLSLVYHIIEI